MVLEWTARKLQVTSRGTMSNSRFFHCTSHFRQVLGLHSWSYTSFSKTYLETYFCLFYWIIKRWNCRWK